MIDLDFDPVAQCATITIRTVGEPPHLDDLYRAHARRIDVQADALDLLLANVQRERLLVARGRFLLLFAWKLARDMGEAPTPSPPSSEPLSAESGSREPGATP